MPVADVARPQIGQNWSSGVMLLPQAAQNIFVSSEAKCDVRTRIANLPKHYSSGHVPVNLEVPLSLPVTRAF